MIQNHLMKNVQTHFGYFILWRLLSIKNMLDCFAFGLAKRFRFLLMSCLHLLPLLLLVLDGPEGALQLFDALPHLLVDVGQGFELVPQV